MRKIEINAKIVTPLFMGGANKQPELRTQSFNGLFRYWFRLAGGKVEDEKKLFGWAGEKSQKGVILLRVETKNLKVEQFSKYFDKSGRPLQGSGLNYLGFALDPRFKQNDKKEIRNFIERNEVFSLQILPYPKATEEDVKKYLCAVWLAFNLGNFGSRARRGFGSISVEQISGDLPKNFHLNFKTDGNLEDWLASNIDLILNTLESQERQSIPYIKYEDDFQIYRINKEYALKNINNWIQKLSRIEGGKYLVKKWTKSTINDPIDLLDFMGFLLMAFRSYYKPDYNTAKAIITGSVQSEVIEKAIFGLPLNFFFSSIKGNNKGMVNLKINSFKTRRASPLWFKILEFNNSFEGLFLIFKSTFAPAGYQLELNRTKIKLPKNNIWEALDKFLNSLEGDKIIHKIY